MKCLLSLLGITLCFALSAQKTFHSSQIFVGINFLPGYSYRTLEHSSTDPNTTTAVDVRNEMEIPKFGYAGGLSVSVQLKKHVGVSIGVQYSDKSYQTKKYDVYYQRPDPAMPSRIRIIYNYHYLDVPLTMNLAFGKKVQFVSSIGMVVNFLLNANQRNILEYENGKTERRDQSSTLDFRKINLSSMMGVGIAYKINGRSFLKVEPTFRYGLLKTVEAPIFEHLWTTGINVGFYHSI